METRPFIDSDGRCLEHGVFYEQFIHGKSNGMYRVKIDETGAHFLESPSNKAASSIRPGEALRLKRLDTDEVRAYAQELHSQARWYSDKLDEFVLPRPEVRTRRLFGHDGISIFDADQINTTPPEQDIRGLRCEEGSDFFA